VRTATNCTRDPVNHAWATCNAAPGVGSLHRWTVNVSGQASSPSTATTSYRVPVLTTVSGPGSSNADTAGGQIVYINGREFGPVSTTVSSINDRLITVLYGPVVRCVSPFTAQHILCRAHVLVVFNAHAPLGALVLPRALQSNLSTYAAVSCTVTSASLASSQLSCVTGQGIGGSLYWTLRIGNQTATGTAGPTSYGRPVVSAFSGAGALSAMTNGSQVMQSLYSRVCSCSSHCSVTCCALTFGLHVRVLGMSVQSVTIIGDNFGAVGTNVTAVYTTSLALSSVATADPALASTFVTPAGA
jgi:hypothetical protein